MASKASFLAICCSLLIFTLFFLPPSLSARVLADVPPSDDVGGDKHDSSPAKSGVRGSPSGHAGSATGNSSPTSSVLLSPPTALTKISVGSVTVNGQPKSPGQP